MKTEHPRRRNRAWRGIALAVALAVAGGATAATAADTQASAEPRAAAVECATPWSSSAVYVGNDVASHAGHNWRAKWWTPGDTPGAAQE
jgi:chitinase